MMLVERSSVLAVAFLLTNLCGCGPSGNTPTASNADASSAPGAAAPQPPDGVPAGTRPLPLPEPGKAYQNPQLRENIKEGGTLTLPIDHLGPNFNLLNADGGTVAVGHIMRWISPHLWDYTPDGGVAPDGDYLLSSELVNADPETVKLTLNPKAKWNDGTPIDWTAFEATWKTQNGADPRYNPAATDGYRSIASVTKGEKDNEVIIVFKEPFYPFEFLFAQIEHPRNLDPDFYKTGWIKNLHPELGAGPFIVESLTETAVTLVRNAKWWGDPAKLERVVYRQMEASAAVNALQNGEVDGMYNVAVADRLEQISNTKNLQIRRGYDIRTVVFVMGKGSTLFKEDAARKAFMLSVDRKLLASIMSQGLDWEEEPPGSSVMFTWQRGYRDNMQDLHYDPAQAAAVLDAAGWKLGDDGYRHKDGALADFTYVDFGDDPITSGLARAVQKMAKSIGLQMNIDIRKSADFGTTFAKRDFDVVLMAWAATDPFGFVNVCQLFCSDSETNFSGLGNEDLDAVLRRPATLANRTAALQTANQAEAEALHLYGLLPLFNGPQMFAVKAGLANFGPAGFLIPEPQNIGWQKDSPQ